MVSGPGWRASLQALGRPVRGCWSPSLPGLPPAATHTAVVLPRASGHSCFRTELRRGNTVAALPRAIVQARKNTQSGNLGRGCRESILRKDQESWETSKLTFMDLRSKKQVAALETMLFALTASL